MTYDMTGTELHRNIFCIYINMLSSKVSTFKDKIFVYVKVST